MSENCTIGKDLEASKAPHGKTSSQTQYSEKVTQHTLPVPATLIFRADSPNQMAWKQQDCGTFSTNEPVPNYGAVLSVEEATMWFGGSIRALFAMFVSGTLCSAPI